MHKILVLAGALTLMAAPALAQQAATGQSSGGYKGNSGNAATTGANMGGAPASADTGMMAKPMKKKMAKKKKMRSM